MLHGLRRKGIPPTQSGQPVQTIGFVLRRKDLLSFSMQEFRKHLTQTYARLEQIASDPYPEPAIDCVAVALLVEKTNQRARKAGCGHLAIRRDDYLQHSKPADQSMRAIERMLAWCQNHEA